MNAEVPASAEARAVFRPGDAITARIDRDGVLLHADAPLLDLHEALSGGAGGELAIPPLLDLARHSQRLRMRLSRPVVAVGTTALVEMWCECTPDGDGVTLCLTHWTERPLPEAPPAPVAVPQTAVDPGSVQFRLDPAGRILRFDPPPGFSLTNADDRLLLKPISALLRSADGAELPALSQLDSAQVMVVGDDRHWLASMRSDPAIAGHILLLTEAPPLSDPAAPPPPQSLFDGERLEHLFGSQIGPALRQPIGRIIANAETIGGRLEGPLRADYAGYASDIAAAGRHLLALVDDLADLEAVEASGFSAAREPVDLADLARRAAGLLALKAAERHIRIDKPAEDETLPAVGEFRRVLQVLLNLLGNAINYAPDGSMIWLRLDDGPGWASITVADQGPGLSADEQQRLFNKWERLGRSGDGGSGLGLYISRRLALAMDGDLTIESAPGQGARFTLTLPAV